MHEIQNFIFSIVNSVGCCHEIPEPFIVVEDSMIDQIVSVNITNTLKVTKLILSEMIEKYVICSCTFTNCSKGKTEV